VTDEKIGGAPFPLDYAYTMIAGRLSRMHIPAGEYYTVIEESMERIPVSSNLRSVGYDAATRTLEVEFKAGGLYRYLNVPAYVYDGLMSASSHGSYFDEHVKKGGYPFIKLP
jgi:hypothetical protein